MFQQFNSFEDDIALNADIAEQSYDLMNLYAFEIENQLLDDIYTDSIEDASGDLESGLADFDIAI